MALILGVLAIPIILLLLLQMPFVQNKLTTWISDNLSAKLNTKVKVGRVNYFWLNRVSLSGFYIQDQHGDTLLYSQTVVAGVHQFSLRKKNLRFSNIVLTKAYINLIADSSRTLNIAFLIDSLRGREDAAHEKMKISFSNIEIKQSHFRFRSYPFTPKAYGVNFTDADLKELSLKLRNLKMSDSISFDIRKMSFIERSGFKVDHLDCNLSIGKGFMIYRDVHLVSPRSDIKASELSFRSSTFRDYAKGSFGQKVRLNFDIQESELDLDDLYYISPILQRFHQTIRFSGKITGRFGDMKGRDIDIRYSTNTRLKCKFDITGLPDVSQTFLYADITRFQTSITDIESIRLRNNLQWINLPPNFRELGKISYTGNFTGFFNDFVAYGNIQTDLGMISTDLLIRPDTSNYTFFKGKVSTRNFDLGRFAQNNSEVGTISMNLNVNGSTCKGRNLKATLNGLVGSFFFHNYNYRNIELDGNIAGNAYDGTVAVEDPNIKMDFNGMLDFAKNPPEFDFSLNIPRIRPYDLHLISKDSALTVSTLVIANFVGTNIDNLNGDIKVLNSVLTRADKQLKINNINLTASNQIPRSRLSLKSDFLDATLEGNYFAKELKSAFIAYMNKYLPSLFDKPSIRLQPQDFSFKVKFKKTDEILSFFVPSAKLADGSTINGHFKTQSQNLSVTAEFPSITYGDLVWSKLYFNISSDDRNLSLESGSELLSIKKQIRLDNLTTYLSAAKDSAHLTFRSLNWDTLVNKGSVNAFATFTRLKNRTRPIIIINLSPTDLIAKNMIWHLKDAHMIIDSSSLALDEFKIYNEKQYFDVYGRISPSKDARLYLDIHNFKVSNLNLFTAEKGFKFDGNISGKAIISDVYTNFIMLGAFDIDTLLLNGEELGATAIETKWDNDEKKMESSLISKRGDLETIKVFGHYIPSERSLDFKIDLDKLRMNVLRPYLAKVVSNLNGIGSGHLNLTGNIQKPLLNGDIELQKISFVINYLHTSNSFSANAKFKDSDILFDNLELCDTNRNKALVSGTVSTNYLKKLNFNIKVDAKKYTFLNTTSQNNELFYGKAYGTGIISITGPIENIRINITASSEKNTQIFIPLATTSQITEINFLSFVSQKGFKQNDNIEVMAPVSSTGLQMYFDLTVTPDADVQLIFDPKIGDIMKGRGNGNLKLEISTLGKFKIYGDYTIEEGEYLFTLRNVINKRFKVEKGGQIQWNGDPKDAIINIKAIYPLKASLYNLLVNETNIDYKKRIPIECQIFMTNKLMRPDLRFGIYLPTSDEETRSRVANAISNGDEMTKQFLSLLVINSFMPDPNRMSVGTPTTAGLGVASVGVTASELFSNQLSNWLSQISKDFDIGWNYRPDNQTSGQEMEVALSTQILNDRVTIRTNLDVGGNQATTKSTNTSNIVGDFDVGIKLNQSGKLNLKVFNRSNNVMQYDFAPYTQGIGLSYREDFNSLAELWKRYIEKLSKKNKDKGGKSKVVDK